MPLSINGISIPSTGKVLQNGVSMSQVNRNGEQVWKQAVEKQYIIYSQATKSGWWSSFGSGAISGELRYWIGRGTTYSPYIDLTRYTKIYINLFCQIQYGGSVGLSFGFCPQSNPNNWVWSKSLPVASYGSWAGPNITGTYDISSLTGSHRIKQVSDGGSGGTVHTFLGTSYFIYLE